MFGREVLLGVDDAVQVRFHEIGYDVHVFELLRRRRNEDVHDTYDLFFGAGKKWVRDYCCYMSTESLLLCTCFSWSTYVIVLDYYFEVQVRRAWVPDFTLNHVCTSLSACHQSSFLLDHEEGAVQYYKTPVNISLVYARNLHADSQPWTSYVELPMYSTR